MAENEIKPNKTECGKDTSSRSSSERYFSASDSATTRTCHFKPFTCSCYAHLEASKLTHNKILALIWALSRVLRHNPSDPLHYMSYQLLRWKYSNVRQECMKDVLDYMDTQM